MSLKTLSREREALVEKLLSQLTLREKVALLSGKDTWSTVPIRRPLHGAPDGIPALVMTDGPHGVRTNQPDASRAVCDTTTAFPTGVSIASTWNPELVHEAAAVLGAETLATGCDILLGPCVNIVRTPIAGRNFEAYGEDPWLAGQIAAAFIEGVQSAGAGTSLKHFAANNQENERFRGSSVVDERTLREIYLPHFENAVKKAQPWTVMCSYNRLNGTYASQHHHLLTEILREEWGFDGFVVSDWTANHTTTQSVEGGLDVEMPGPAKWYGDLLAESVMNWQIDPALVDQAARRVLRIIARSGRLDGKGAARGHYSTTAHQQVAQRVAEEAIVLLKNDRHILPLAPEKMQTLAVIGSAARGFAISGGGSAHTEPPFRAAPLTALQEQIGGQVEVRYEPGADNWSELPVINPAWLKPAGAKGKNTPGLAGEYYAGETLEGKPVLSRLDPRLDYYWFSTGPDEKLPANFSAEWKGTLQVPETSRYTLQIHHTGIVRLTLDGETLLEQDAGREAIDTIDTVRHTLELKKDRPYRLEVTLRSRSGQRTQHIRVAMGATPAEDTRFERAVQLAREAETALVFVGDNEAWETEGVDRPHMRLPGRQDELVSAVAAVNPRTIVVLNTGAPVEMPWLRKVAAVVQMHYPGMMGGEAITRVLTGAVNPSGKLSASYPTRMEETPSFHNLSLPNMREVLYGEGIFVGYRHYDRVKTGLLFPFGHGLSYTTFRYRSLRAPRQVRPGKPFSVRLQVTNTGSVAGKEIVQLYVADHLSSVPRPLKELKGFAKVELAPGETKTVEIALDMRSLAFYDPLRQCWVAEEGEYELIAAASAADIRLHRTIRLTETWTGA